MIFGFRCWHFLGRLSKKTFQRNFSTATRTMNKYKNSATNLASLSKEDFLDWFNSFDTVLADCDGVLWIYNNTLKGSPEVINKFGSLGKKMFFVTNNSTKTREEFLDKAQKMNFNVNKDCILSTAYLAAQYLKQRNFTKKVFIIGSPGIAKELDNVGIRHTDVGPDVLKSNLYNFVHDELVPDPEVGCVIVGFDEHFSFPKMTRAATYLSDPKVLFIATNTDERFPMPDFVVPGTGSFVRCIETCAERKATVMGKPNPYICDCIVNEYGIVPEKTLMIGDRCNTDILLGKNCGFQTLLVETGIHKFADVKTYMESNDPEVKKLVPDFYIASLGDLLPQLEGI